MTIKMMILQLLLLTALSTLVDCQRFGGILGGGNKNSGGGPISTLTDSLSKATQLFTQQFADFKNTFKKVYSSPEEEKKRLQIFSENQKYILDFAQLTNIPYKLHLNEFSDLLQEEFNRLLNGLKLNKAKSHATEFTPESSKTIPDNVDWRDAGAVTPSRSQGLCGSCYAFATAAALEGQLFKSTGKLETLSPQNIMDCTIQKPYENYGCTSGAVDPSFDFIKDNGINTEAEYPYLEKAEQDCSFKPEKSVTKIKGYELLDEGDERALQEAIATKGPVTVAIDAHAKSFQNYGGGVYYEPECNPSNVNHAVLVVGYTPSYWIIKNSYGPTWGENGFAKISRNVTNHCGIATYAVVPVL